MAAEIARFDALPSYNNGMLELEDVILLCLLLVIGYGWWAGMGVKAHALKFTRQYCQELGYQLLDQTMVFRGFRLIQDAHQRHRLCRHYAFDVSLDGTDRYSGEVSLSRGRVIRVLLHTDHTDITQVEE